MVENKFSFIVGGKAGEGVKKAGQTASHLFAHRERYVFQMDDYQSLIKGGHNFSVISTSPEPIKSHYMKADLVVALDANSYELHKDHLTEKGIMVHNSDVIKDAEGFGVPLTTEAKKYPNPALRVGLGAVAALAAAVGLSENEFKILIEKEYKRDLENNTPYALTIFNLCLSQIGSRFKLKFGEGRRPLITGNEAISLGAAAGGLDLYIAYPMTPASSVLHYLAAHDEELGVTVVHPENEITVINMAIGAAYAGARSMVGSSGGGFALMEEAFSLAGMTETPLLCILSSRPGPSTGIPTYTSQGDLNFALYQGHGEFPRLVASPGSVEEAFYLTAEMLNLVWKFQTPGILLTEKHLSESSMTVEIDSSKAQWPEPLMHTGGEYKRYLDTPDGISPMLFPPSKELIKWNSYEHDELGITTEDPEISVKMRDNLLRKQETIIDYLKGTKTVNVYGSKGLNIFTYGSSTMSVLEALSTSGIESKVIQPIYLEPLPVWELDKYRISEDANIVVEQSSTGQFATHLRNVARIDVDKVIKRYDGRPFEPEELAESLREVV